MIYHHLRVLVIMLCLLLLPEGLASAATVQEQIFAHPKVEDKYGVITPWYSGQNGQFDNRVRIAAETIKRYPWVTKDEAIAIAPDFAFSSTWRIAKDGTISTGEAVSILVDPRRNFLNGVLGQNAARLVNGLVEYYQYSGDPAALAIMTLVGDTFLDFCLTPAQHPWPEFPISVPVQGKPYGRCDPKGWIQLDIVGELSVALLRGYQVTGKQRWLKAVTHWGELLAARRNRTPGIGLWPRYANPEDVYPWWDQSGNSDQSDHWNTERSGNIQEGTIVYVLAMFDELIRLGEHGEGNSFDEARAAGQAYLRDTLLPRWFINSTWGHNYWDGEKPMQLQTTTDWAMRYLLAHKDVFPNWRNDIRNVLSLFLNRTSSDPAARTDTYSGAWAFPEGTDFSAPSLAWGPMEFALVLSRYGVEADSEWGRELARRMEILSTYDSHETGVVEDNIDGGAFSADSWFIGTHPSTLAWVLKTMGWQPAILGANRENHIMRSTGVVKRVSYRKGRVAYSTYDAPAGTEEVLRLAFAPSSVKACGEKVAEANDPTTSYTVEEVKGGDYIVSIRHEGCIEVLVEGQDPQAEKMASGLSWSFQGNQVRLLGTVGPNGGQADVYLDGEKQLAGIDFWNQDNLTDQVVYYRSGLSNGQHEIQVVPRTVRNPLSAGDKITIEWLQYSAATGDSGVGVGGGPTDTQRMVFGYTGREDYMDSEGHLWRPGTEFVTRTGPRSDPVAKAWWTLKQAVFIKDTPDDSLYQYGVHWPEIVVNVTVGPGTYYVRLKLAETQYQGPGGRLVNLYINGKQVAEDLDVYATAGGAATAVDLVYEKIEPKNGIIEVRLKGGYVNGRQSEAILQALEVGLYVGDEAAALAQSFQ